MTISEGIKAYLEERFKSDATLKAKFEEKQLSYSDCVNAIIEWARQKLKNQSGAIEDKEVFEALVHFILDGETPQNHIQDLTEEEIAQAQEKGKQDAIRKIEAEAEEMERKKREKQQAKFEKEEAKRKETGQMSLFDL